MAISENGNFTQFFVGFASERIKLVNQLNFIAKEGNPPRCSLIMGGENINRVSSYTESPPRKIHVIAFILEVYKGFYEARLTSDFTFFDGGGHLQIHFRRSNAVNAGN